jgi:hypothetical protein
MALLAASVQRRQNRPLDIDALAVKLFRSGRTNGKECKESRKQLDSLLADEIRTW